VRVFDAAAARTCMDIGKRGSGPGEFNLPRDLAIGTDGRLYVVDGGNFRVVVFDRDGRYLQSFGSVGKQYGQFARPKEVAIDRDGNVYVVDTAFGNFQIFNPEGELLLFVGDRSERDGPAATCCPRASRWTRTAASRRRPVVPQDRRLPPGRPARRGRLPRRARPARACAEPAPSRIPAAGTPLPGKPGASRPVRHGAFARRPPGIAAPPGATQWHGFCRNRLSSGALGSARHDDCSTNLREGDMKWHGYPAAGGGGRRPQD
jgi:hypothetical protein